MCLNPKIQHALFLTLLLTSFVILMQCTAQQAEEQTATQKPNILFIAVDDLRPELNCYGAQHIHSPNMDKLASQGVMFKRAYCNIPVCGASRASLLTGTRPTRNRFLGYDTYAEKDYPEAVTLPQVFRQAGYHTVSNGKIFHHQNDSQDSWDEIWKPKNEFGSNRDYRIPANVGLDTLENSRGMPYEKADVADSAYFDGKIANKAITDLRKLKENEGPFFLALGFLKPHLPFNAPSQYWEMYQRDRITLPDNYAVPENAPEAAIHNFGELRSYHDIPKNGALTDSMAISLIHGYYACVSYTDAQIGKVLDELDNLGLRENTIVVLWGDHGWNLGEHSLWCKHSNFNTALQVPMFFSGPGIPQGKTIENLVEYVDIYPTLCELAGVDPPADQLEGMSMMSLMNDENAQWKDHVISKYFDGISVRTDQYLYTEWSKSDTLAYARMLYDHKKDPNETINIAESTEMQGTIDQLQQTLHNNWGKDFNQK